MSVTQRLQDICIRDNAVLLQSGNEPIKITTRARINFQCSCGNTFEKKIYTALEYGLYCPECTRIRTQEKTQHTCMERYGAPYPTQCPAIVAKRKPLTNIEEIKEKRVQTNMTRYGVAYPYQSKEFLEKCQKTFLDRYGTTAFLHSPEVNQRRKETWLAKYGTDNPNKNPDIIEKRRITLSKKKIDCLHTEDYITNVQIHLSSNN